MQIARHNRAAGAAAVHRVHQLIAAPFHLIACHVLCPSGVACDATRIFRHRLRARPPRHVCRSIDAVMLALLTVLAALLSLTGGGFAEALIMQ